MKDLKELKRRIENKVEQFEAINQFRIYGDYKEIFQSYNSTIAIITQNPSCIQHIELGVDWNYSRTTMKYLRHFLDKYSNMKVYEEPNIKKYINKLIKESSETSLEDFVNKYNFILTYNENLV